MNKVRELLLRYLQKMPSFPVRAMWAIYAYAAFMFSSLLIYISMILVLWNRTGLEPIEDMKEFCEVLFSSAAVTAASFCARYLVDDNKDGVPDAQKDERGERRI